MPDTQKEAPVRLWVIFIISNFYQGICKQIEFGMMLVEPGLY
jgi:hypothetical protein